jgi:hypothetical protein
MFEMPGRIDISDLTMIAAFVPLEVIRWNGLNRFDVDPAA